LHFTKGGQRRYFKKKYKIKNHIVSVFTEKVALQSLQQTRKNSTMSKQAIGNKDASGAANKTEALKVLLITLTEINAVITQHEENLYLLNKSDKALQCIGEDIIPAPLNPNVRPLAGIMADLTKEQEKITTLMERDVAMRNLFFLRYAAVIKTVPNLCIFIIKYSRPINIAFVSQEEALAAQTAIADTFANEFRVGDMHFVPIFDPRILQLVSDPLGIIGKIKHILGAQPNGFRLKCCISVHGQQVTDGLSPFFFFESLARLHFVLAQIKNEYNFAAEGLLITPIIYLCCCEYADFDYDDRYKIELLRIIQKVLAEVDANNNTNARIQCQQ
jgi:hypothetical protein